MTDIPQTLGRAVFEDSEFSLGFRVLGLGGHLLWRKERVAEHKMMQIRVWVLGFWGLRFTAANNK